MVKTVRMMKARHNPFRTERVLEIRYRLLDTCWDDLFKRLEELGFRAAITGEHGTGKTTLLEDMEPRLVDRGFIPILLFQNDTTTALDESAYKPFFKEITSDHIILFDGADLLTNREWIRFAKNTRKAGGLIITSHQDELLPVLTECRTTFELLDEIVKDLLGAGSGPAKQTLQELFITHNGNIRDVLRALYDVYAGG